MTVPDLEPTGPMVLLRVDERGTVLDAGPYDAGGPLRPGGGSGSSERSGSSWHGAALLDHTAPSQHDRFAAWVAAACSDAPPAEPFLWRARGDAGIPLVTWFHAVGRGGVTAQRAGGAGVAAGDTLPDPGPRTGPDHVLNHDVRAGLRAARSFVALHARRTSPSPTGPSADDEADDRDRHHLDTAGQALLTTDVTVDGLVRFHRIGTDPLTMGRVPLDDLVVRAARRASDALRDLAGSPQWRDLADGLVVHGPGRAEGDDLCGDRDLLEWVLAELCVNARKFAGGPTVVTIAATANNGWACVRVGNSGVPVDPELAEDAFALGRLLQGRGARPGVGLGLSLCRRIVTRHAGSIAFTRPNAPESETGSVIECELPLADRLRPAPSGPEPRNAR